MSQNKPQQNKDSVIQIPKAIIYTGKFLQFFSYQLATEFASKLFITPIQFKRPEREKNMVEQSKKTTLQLEEINKAIKVYEYGNHSKKVLLVHGWSGRGTQMCKIADQLIASGYGIVSFDAPAHGESEGKTTMMNEFVAAIHEINEHYGPFEYAVGHSLGGISLLNAVNQGLDIKRLVTIGAGNSIDEICKLFIKNLELKEEVAKRMKQKFDGVFGEDIEIYSSYSAAKGVKIPVLLIHDNDDLEIPVKVVDEICKELSSSTTFITSHLGHRKILGSDMVIEKIIDYFKN